MGFMQEIQPSLLKYIIIKQDESVDLKKQYDNIKTKLTLQLQQL
jgi:hypothetical protein